MRRLAWSLVPFGVALVCFQGCYGATEILVQVETDVSCATVRTTGITVRATGASSALGDATVLADSTQCTDGATGQPNQLGTLVFIPTEGTPEVSIRVVLGVERPSSSCDASGAGCVVADRRLGYEKHRTLRLPIRLDEACLGRICGEGLTCAAGNCVSSSASCHGSDCTSVDPIDASVPPTPVGPIELDSGILDAGRPPVTPIGRDAGLDAGRAACEPVECAKCAGGTVCCIETGAIQCRVTEARCKENGVLATQACNPSVCPCTDGKTCQLNATCGGGTGVPICGGSCLPAN